MGSPALFLRNAAHLFREARNDAARDNCGSALVAYGEAHMWVGQAMADGREAWTGEREARAAIKKRCFRSGRGR